MNFMKCGGENQEAALVYIGRFGLSRRSIELERRKSSQYNLSAGSLCAQIFLKSAVPHASGIATGFSGLSDKNRFRALEHAQLDSGLL